MAKLSKLYGVGVNDADYPVQISEVVGKNENGKLIQKNVFMCQYYDRWHSMLRRCYSNSFKRRVKNYDGCTVSDEWLIFSNFKRWMEQQDWVGKALDKDILQLGNKIYSPETCAFVSYAANGFVIDRSADRGPWPLGVSFHKKTGKFRAYCNNPEDKKPKHIGLFDCPEQAHKAWRKYKHNIACKLAQSETDERVRSALASRYAT